MSIINGGGNIIDNSFNLININKEELLFLHLLKNQKEQDKYIASKLITQQGIQSVLGCHRSLISRLINKNVKKGYIYRTLSKIEDKKRKQNVYFLTDEGVKIALEITNSYVSEQD